MEAEKRPVKCVLTMVVLGTLASLAPLGIHQRGGGGREESKRDESKILPRRTLKESNSPVPQSCIKTNAPTPTCPCGKTAPTSSPAEKRGRPTLSRRTSGNYQPADERTGPDVGAGVTCQATANQHRPYGWRRPANRRNHEAAAAGGGEGMDGR